MRCYWTCYQNSYTNPTIPILQKISMNCVRIFKLQWVGLQQNTIRNLTNNYTSMSRQMTGDMFITHYFCICSSINIAHISLSFFQIALQSELPETSFRVQQFCLFDDESIIIIIIGLKPLGTTQDTHTHTNHTPAEMRSEIRLYKRHRDLTGISTMTETTVMTRPRWRPGIEFNFPGNMLMWGHMGGTWARWVPGWFLVGSRWVLVCCYRDLVGLVQ